MDGSEGGEKGAPFTRSENHRTLNENENGQTLREGVLKLYRPRKSINFRYKVIVNYFFRIDRHKRLQCD